MACDTREQVWNCQGKSWLIGGLGRGAWRESAFQDLPQLAIFQPCDTGHGADYLSGEFYVSYFWKR